MKTRTVLLGLMAVAATVVGSQLKSQSLAHREIAVAIVDSLPKPGSRAEIIRFSDASKPDVILLGRDATPELLAAAILAYRSSIARTGARPGLIGRTVLTDQSIDVPATADLRARAAAMLSKVKREPPARVGNYGRGRWATFQVTVGG